mgnify:CR=1 FL=1
MRELYKVEELKDLEFGDKVFIEFNHDEDGEVKMETEVVAIDSDNVFFDYGYCFPIQYGVGVETVYAVQDTGDYVFKVFKID